MFIWYFSLNTYFLMHCKRPSGFSMAFSKCLFIRPHARIIDSASSSVSEWDCIEYSLVRTSHFPILPITTRSHSLFFYVRCEINQYKANNRIVYLIYLSGAAIRCQVHSWSVYGLCIVPSKPLHCYCYRYYSYFFFSYFVDFLLFRLLRNTSFVYFYSHFNFLISSLFFFLRIVKIHVV